MLHQLGTILRSFFRNLSKSVISPYINHKYEVPLKLIALFCLMNLAPKYFVVQSKEELKTENRLSTFVAVGVVNTEIFMSFIKRSFYKQTDYYLLILIKFDIKRMDKVIKYGKK